MAPSDLSIVVLSLSRPHGTPITCQVFSWDTSTNAPDEDETDGRSYISAVSEVITDDSQTCTGRAKKEMGEARMDIEDSEMGYLGYHGSESYGLTWKVRQETVCSHEMIGHGVIQYDTRRNSGHNCSYSAAAFRPNAEECSLCQLWYYIEHNCSYSAVAFRPNAEECSLCQLWYSTDLAIL